MEIIAIPSFSPGGLNEYFHLEFGKCETFTFITIEGNEITEVKAIENPAVEEPSGKGKQSAQIIKSYGAEKLIVSELGPNASALVNSLNITVYLGPTEEITLKEVIKSYLKGNLKAVSPNDLSKGVLNKDKKKRVKN
ncbi:MAG: NifB/NifX family molybdenum-iron cluster-binding protein [Candidatus Lokiarchaeota archaeon]|nr:NifB/NifX family molybdenum-iron cluster-binding protein [Candidatus Lokiarchaeota archaeon]